MVGVGPVGAGPMRGGMVGVGPVGVGPMRGGMVAGGRLAVPGTSTGIDGADIAKTDLCRQSKYTQSPCMNGGFRYRIGSQSHETPAHLRARHKRVQRIIMPTRELCANVPCWVVDGVRSVL